MDRVRFQDQMLKNANRYAAQVGSLDDHSVFQARRSNGSLSLIEISDNEARSVYRRYLAALDERAAKLILGKPSDDVARRVLELAESFLRERDTERAAKVLRMVIDSGQFPGTQEEALATAALKNLCLLRVRR